MISDQVQFLHGMLAAARQAGHIWPAYAACEAALESAWGRSQLAKQANNFFGQKQSHPPLEDTGTLSLPTREYLGGEWRQVAAEWVRFRDEAGCFRARMDLLRRLAGQYPEYAGALKARDGESYVRLVSSRWSTDPGRAGKVIAIHQAHLACFPAGD